MKRRKEEPKRRIRIETTDRRAEVKDKVFEVAERRAGVKDKAIESMDREAKVMDR